VPIPLAQIRDDGVYRFTCPVGHDSAVVLANLKFELLFEVGVHAILDGYSRDAITSFASSLETFYEFVFRVVARKLSLDDKATNQVWNIVARQSERQLGLYLASYSLLTKEVPPILDGANVEFRNKVIHKAYIPTNDEAIAFGNTVLEIVDSTLDSLKHAAGSTVVEVYEQLLPPSLPDRKPDGSEIMVGRTNILTTIDVCNPREGDARRGTVEKQLERITHRRSEERRMRPMSDDEARQRGLSIPVRSSN
jgi:hypothetical protein